MVIEDDRQQATHSCVFGITNTDYHYTPPLLLLTGSTRTNIRTEGHQEGIEHLDSSKSLDHQKRIGKSRIID